jgi:hypothetical protein
MEAEKNNRYKPTVYDRASEVSDHNQLSRYGSIALQVNDIFYGELGAQVDQIYADIGARVVRGISYAGEDPTTLLLPAEEFNPLEA